MAFLPNSEKKSQSSIFYILFLRLGFPFTHKLHGDVLLQFNGNSMCNSYFFLLTKNDIIVHYNKFPNLGVCHANFPNLKGPKALSKILKKSLVGFENAMPTVLLLG